MVDGGDNPAFWNLSMFGHGTSYLDEQKAFRNILLAFPYDWFLDHSGAVAKVRECSTKYQDFVGTDKYDSVLSNALAQGIEDNLVALLMRRTCGQTGDFSTCSPHYQLEDWATAVRKVASEYGKAIKFYEVWDEPGFDTSCGDDAASQRFGDKGYEKYADVYSDYLPVLQRAYQEIEAGEKACAGGQEGVSTVISGSLLHNDPYLYPPDDPNNPYDGVNATAAFDVYKNLFNHIGSGPPDGGEDVSIVASSKDKFVAERPIYFSYQDYKKNGGPALEETATVNRRGGHVAAGYPVKEEPGGSSTWYFAEGCTQTGLGMEEYICVYNPNDEEIRVGRRYSGSSEFKGGYTKNEQTQEYTYDEDEDLLLVPAHKRETILVHDPTEAGLDKDVSVYIEGFIPGKEKPYAPIPKKVFAERVVYFNFRGFSGGHCAVGRPSPANSWYFAEGTTRNNAYDGRYETYICIQNPQGTTATCTLTYMPTNGANMSETISIGPNTRYTVCPVNVLGENVDFSTYFLSDVPVVAERPMYFSRPNGINDGSVEVGATTARNDFYFAEGATYHDIQEYLCIQNPQPGPAHVTLTYMTASDPVTKEFDIPGRSRHTVDVNADIGPDQDVSVHVHATRPVVAERPMYFNYDTKRDEVFIPGKRDPAEVAIRYGGGHVSSGIASPAKKYVFAEGLAGHYFEEYICLQNPNSKTIEVTLDFYSKWGKCWSKTYKIEGNTRKTVLVFEELALFNCCDAVGVHFLRNPLGDDGMSWVRGYRLLRNLMNEYQRFKDKELIVTSCGWVWSQCGSSGTPMEVGEYTHEQARKGLLYAPSSGSQAGLNGLFFEDAQDRCTKAWYYIDIDGPYTVDNLLYGLYDHLNHVPTCVWSETGYEGGYKKWQEAIPDTQVMDPEKVLPRYP
ncbi:MAG: hypothetical protein KKF41_11855 [Actinobacteria bacterium]|nr:hypothetical protein [Actinomycetota bacterium]MBU1944285.1 hypothetical protein [Actinomycetota bacterium]MBU2688270.1 hypothetical protein [Actinomycetota bacterium]